MKKIFSELKNFKGSVLLIVLASIGITIGNLALPYLLSFVINVGIPASDTSYFLKTGLLMLGFVLLSFVSNGVSVYSSAKISMGVGKSLRSQIFKKIQYFSKGEIDRFSTSSLITRTTSDVTQIQNFFNNMMRMCLQAPFMFIGGVILAFNKNKTMASIIFISMPVMILVFLVISKFATPISAQLQEKTDELNLITREKLTGIQTIRVFGTEDYETERFRKTNSEYMEYSVRLNNIMAILMPVLTTVLNLSCIGLLAFGGNFIVSSSAAISIGDIIALIQYVMQIMIAVMMLAMILVAYPRASVSAKRITQVLNTENTIKEPAAAVTTEKGSGTLEFADVSFSYPDAPMPALENVNFVSRPGEITAIIGSTGCGKSTFVNLIPRLYDVTKGKILLNGQDIRDYEIKDLRSRIGMVPQKAFLFKGDIKSNMLFGYEAADENRIKEALAVAQAEKFVYKRDDSLGSPVSQGGSNFSGGQKQRLSIARAAVRKPDIYIFDDSFSALDYKTDAALRKALKSYAANATVILVAQRISTIVDATRIIVLDEGHCVGIGTHDELTLSCSVYREIVESQLGKESA